MSEPTPNKDDQNTTTLFGWNNTDRDREVIHSSGNALHVAMTGTNDAGDMVSVPVTAEGHIEVAIHSPRLPFGAVHTENLVPVFQTDAVYGVRADQVTAITGHSTGGASSATVTGTDNLFKCSTGTTSLSFASLQSRKRLRYRSGQGVVGRFTAVYSTPAASSILVAGLGTSESGFYFGYNGTSFGILYNTGGKREIQTLTINTASSTAENVTVTLNGVAHSIAVTASGNAQRTAYELSLGTYKGFSAEARGNTVVFLSSDVGNKTGSFSVSGTTISGSFAETLQGSAGTDTWITQSSWNGDPLDGTGPSGATLDPSKGNVFQIGIQYLGFGSITFQVEVAASGNNPDFVTVHTIRFPNTSASTNVTQPSFPFTMAAYSAGSTTDVWVATASFAGLIEGDIYLTGPRHSFVRETNGFVGSTASTYYPLFTIRNSLVYNSRANQSVINVRSISGAHDDTTPVTFYLLKNAALVGNPNFTTYSSSSSSCFWDVSSTSCTISDNNQLVFALQLGQNSSGLKEFNNEQLTIQPGESLTLAARAVTGTATYVNGSLNIREDQ